MHREAPEPIVIAGMACRFPGGAHDPEAYWRLLADGAHAFSEVPPERWSPDLHWSPDPGDPGRTATRRGAFLQVDLEAFDAAAFGLSPREAARLDPQQRLLLELCHEALEDAGWPAGELSGSDTGVYVGGFTLDHLLNQLAATNRPLVDAHTAAGAGLTMLSNRLSYAFDLRGPSLTLDTACSSSLVALHYAVTDLRLGRCEAAVVAGVSVCSEPGYWVAMSKGGFLSPSGRSRPFARDPDGYVRGEGAGVLLLTRADRAPRRRALVLHTGVGQDGRSEGLTVPREEAQERLMRRVYDEAGVDPRAVAYVEAHGTGTPVGDPVEARALGAVVGRVEDPCPMGSVKANIGHLEAAAGVAGVIKAVLCLERGEVPPHRNADDPNPDIPLDALGLRLPTRVEALASRGTPRIGVSAYGYGGTNAHAVLEAADPNAQTATPTSPAVVLPLTARSPEALRDLAGAWRVLAADPDAPPLADAAWTAATGRDHHLHRLALPAGSWSEVRERLDAWLAGDAAGVPSGVLERHRAPRPVLVFTGMGPQHREMGRQLYAAEPVFREALDAVAAAVARVGGLDLLQAMWHAPDPAEPRVAQPASFALQVALARTLEDRGVRPAAVVGHSAGEVAAAHVAGALDLEDAARVIVHRGRLQQRAHGLGRMLAVGIGEDRARALVEAHPGAGIAAINAPASVTLSGSAAAMAAIAAEAEAAGWFHRTLPVEVAYHSAHMDPLEEDLRAALADLAPRAPRVPLFSTALGERVEGAVHDAAYWWRNVRDPVRFAAAVEGLAGDGYRLYVEVGPHPVLRSSLRLCLADAGVEGQVLESLRRDRDEGEAVGRLFAALFVAGSPLSWARVLGGGAHARIPGHPWQRTRLWAETARSRAARLGTGWHPVLGSPQDQPGPAWELPLAGARLSRLRDHRVQGVPLLPGAAVVELALAAGGAALTRVRFLRPLPLDGSRTVLRTEVDGGGVAVFAREGDGTWTRLGTARTTASAASPAPPDLDGLRAQCPEHLDGEEVARRLAVRGMDHGPAFRRLAGAWLGEGQALGLLEGVEALSAPVLDAALQVLALAGSEGTWVPASIARVEVHGPPTPRLWIHATGGTRADLRLVSAEGVPVASLLGVRLARLPEVAEAEPVFESTWVEVDPEEGEGTPQLHEATVDPADPTGARAAATLIERVRDLAGTPAELVVLTRGATPTGGAVLPASAAVWGVARTARLEHPELRIRLVDLGAEPAEGEAEALARELRATTGEHEVALRGGRRLAHRLVPPPPPPPALRRERRAPGPGEVEIAVRLAPLGFKDALKAAGALDASLLEHTGSGEALGAEVVGEVVRTGPGVTALAVGEEIIAAAPGALRTHLTLPVATTPWAPLVDALGRAWIGGLTSHLTAWVALVHAARLAPGETVLVHGALGGVGRAAAQLVRWIGARALVTAGTAERRAALAAAGLEVVGDSRTGAFAGAALEATGGGGVDVVLGARGGEVREASLGVLAPFGRYVEIGKAGMAEDAPLGLGAFTRGQSFHAVDLDAMVRDRPELFSRALEALRPLAHSGVLEPLPVELYPAARLDRALARAGSGEAEGRVVLDLESLPAELHLRGTWLLTGGLGALGLEIAAWLVAGGVRSIALASRRVDRAEDAVAALRATGAQVLVRACDVSDAAQVRDLVDGTIDALGPLTGVVHAAGVAEDRPLVEVDAASLERVLATKAAGALHLHAATAAQPVAHFACLSSVAGLLGNRGQASYAAASAFLDAFAHQRRAAGLPATTLDLGPVSGGGMATRDPRLLGFLSRLGLDAVDPATVCAHLGAALRQGVTQRAIAAVRWSRWARANPAAAASPTVRELVGPVPEGGGAVGASLDERVGALLAAVLGSAPERIRWDARLDELGLDSLLVTELLAGLHRDLGVVVSGVQVLRGITATRLVELVRESQSRGGR